MEIQALDKLPATPMWEQYKNIKKDALDSLLFYRMGDFYELFLDDAIEAASILGITLTARNRNEEFPVPMCGVPFHSANNYINKLLQTGKRVAICEQTEEASATKGIVKREIVRIVSPGMVLDQDTLESSSNNFLLVLAFDREAISQEEKRKNSGAILGNFCAIDISTGKMQFAAFSSTDDLRDEMALLHPKEIIAPQSEIGSELWNTLMHLVGKEYFLCVSPAPDFYFHTPSAFENLCAHFGVLNLEAFGLSKESSALGVIGAAYRNTRDTQKLGSLRHLQAPTLREKKNFLQLDESTIDHLDLFPKPSQAPQDSLFFHMDRTVTAMGARQLKEILARPLCAKSAIEERQEAVETLLENYSLLQRIRDALTGMRDIERLVSKIGLRSATPRDLEAMKDIFARLPRLKESLQSLTNTKLLRTIENNISCFEDLFSYLDLRLKEELPAITREGNIFKAGWHVELDELISLTDDGRSFITNMELKERESTGINSLKIKYNKVFGYFIEVTSANLDSVPAHYIRKQTTANGERYLTDELKKFEDKILRAEDKRIALEEALFTEALETIGVQSQKILFTAQQLSMLDVLQSFAVVTREHNYVKPSIHEDVRLSVEEGRHPALENLVGRDKFIANAVSFTQKDRLFLITGPNMAGKSTYMRQVALITLLAHTGSFVPAVHAEIGLVDRIATRVGASDRIGRGQSTFMVEMNEMARILRQATEKSLLIIDEIGRGTSTFDGMALAWAILEDLQGRLSCRTLFATHYHELTALEEQLSGIKNLSVSVGESAGEILFLHKVIPGKASGSYGVEVAQLAGLPKSIVDRSRSILNDLEKSGSKLRKTQKDTMAKSQQLNFFTTPASAPSTEKIIPKHLEQLEQSLQAIDINQCTPFDALIKLKSLKDNLQNQRPN